MTAPMTQPPPQQQTQPRYLVSQPPLPPQQTSTKNVQASSGPTATSSSAVKKAPAVPPGMFPSTGPPITQPAYSTAYGVQQQTGGAAYSTPYDEHLFNNAFMPLVNAQQTQSPAATYGSVTPPTQQQQTNNNNDNKTMKYEL